MAIGMGGAGVMPGEFHHFGGRLTSGCCSTSERRALGSVSSASGVIYLAFWRAPASFTAANMRMVSTNTAAGATPTIARFGVWTVATNGDLTLAASTANDTAVFAAANTAYQRALTASLDIQVGAWYATGALVVTGAAAPTILASPSSTSGRLAMGSAPRLAMSWNGGGADLPASIASGALSAADACSYAELTT